ncbi:ADP-ribose glycohydrolase MACROD1 [Strongylocentrotus purpuratus]|uniref:Macro domain-containing protein n=1 Tax=Strongylocentrotus purpuratus TaxID=7668 RepID=A0A7M7RDN2_STRPU|nr:ADP-ribose glycohydrolase MACROD1 [Strongylocentrotus purpuratus]|eukprot:XP_784605.2 PREDICTED: O-acetyl-ADP-ribose deacetylase MACROD1 [Strongylocentrotus purpuratus]
MHLAVAKILYPNTKHSIRVFAGASKGSSLSAAAAVGSCCSASRHRNYTAVINFKHPFLHASASGPGLLTSKVCNMEDFLPPSLRRFYTDEPASGSLAKVKKTRALYLNKTLDEKAEEARWYRQDLVDLREVLTWPDYAEDMGLDTPQAKKSTSAAKSDLNNRVSVWQGDITKLDVDCIVNAANRSLLGGGGVDGAIHRAAGSNLLQECKKLAGCETGDAKLTAGYLLPSRYVLHTVGPMVYGQPMTNHREDLTSCYATCLHQILEHNKHNRSKLESAKRKEDAGKGDEGTEDEKDDKEKESKEDASANGRQASEEEGDSNFKTLQEDLETVEPLIRSVAFPCISTGVYGYPQEEASRVALGTVREWLEENPEEVDRIVFCIFLDRDLKVYERLLPTFFPLEGTSPSSRTEEEDET